MSLSQLRKFYSAEWKVILNDKVGRTWIEDVVAYFKHLHAWLKEIMPSLSHICQQSR
jgi:hypothetical protein